MPIAAIIAILNALVQLEPLAADVVPIVQKMLEGTAPSETDIATIDAANAAINAKLTAQLAAVAPATPAA